MRKRSLFKIIVMMLVFILLFVGLFLFSEKIYKLEFIESIKKAINEKVIDEDEENITIVDVTNISMQDGFNHECVLFTKYNEQEHWKECKICGEKKEVSKHRLNDNGWTMGNSCNISNVHKFTCVCGYKYETQDGKASCNMVWNNWSSEYSGGYYCSKCGRLDNLHLCKRNGIRITCSNLGTCSVCGYNYVSKGMHCDGSNGDNGGKRYCMICNKYIGKLEESYLQRQSDLVYKYVCKFTTLTDFNYSHILKSSSAGDNVTIITDMTNSGNIYTITATLTFNKHTEGSFNIAISLIGKSNGGFSYSLSSVSDNEVKADIISPTIVSISKQDLTEWSKTKQITIAGKENYCNTVKVKIVEFGNEENIVFEGQTQVNNKNYSISCTPIFETEISGKTYKCIVTDNCENSAEEVFEIAKVDSVPPVPTSENSVSSEWAREKLFTFCSTDYGIGEVEIAFNDENDYQLATENEIDFTRKYKFIGDVYSPKQAVALYKDGLGNVSSKEITLDKLDNTAPTITNVEIHNNKLKVTSNDIHKTLGEGSGVTKYRYLASMEKLNNPELTLENSIEVRKYDEIIIPDVYKMKYVYVVAEDLVRKYRKCI